jgi:hypothetical protein
MKRGTRHTDVLRDDRKVISPVNFSVFSVFAPFTAPVSEAVFLCPAGLARVAATVRLAISNLFTSYR